MNTNIRNKLLILFGIIMISLSLSTGIYQYSVSIQNIKSKIGNTNLWIVEQISASIDFLQQDIDDLSTFIVISPELQSLTTLSKSNTKQLTGKETAIFNNATRYLNNLLASKSYISFISIYGNNGIPYYLASDGSISITDYSVVKSTSIYRKAEAFKGNPFWSLLGNDTGSFIKVNMHPKIASCRSLLNTDRMTLAGFMMICVNISTIEQICTAKGTMGSDIIVFDDKDNLICSTNRTAYTDEDMQQLLKASSSDGQGRASLTLHGRSLLLAYNRTGKSNWRVLSLVSDAVTGQKLQTILGTGFIITLNCIIVIYLLFIFVSTVFTKPFNKLLLSMKRLQEGDFEERVNFSYRDEVGLLGAGYDAMVDSIQLLVNKVYKAQLKEKEAELKCLQAQINPHFLYNTLDSIFRKSRKSGDTEVSEMIYTLSRLFRQILNSGNEFTTIAQEKELIENYLLLQKKRYKQKLNYIIQLDEDLLDCPIPNLLMQPLVENAIVHGIIPKNKEGMIVISGCRRDNNITLKIIDNGVGMEAEKVDELFSTGIKAQKSHGYAIRNIQERLELYYGKNHEFSIISSSGHGTTVTILLKMPAEA